MRVSCLARSYGEVFPLLWSQAPVTVTHSHTRVRTRVRTGSHWFLFARVCVCECFLFLCVSTFGGRSDRVYLCSRHPSEEMSLGGTPNELALQQMQLERVLLENPSHIPSMIHLANISRTRGEFAKVLGHMFSPCGLVPLSLSPSSRGRVCCCSCCCRCSCPCRCCYCCGCFRSLRVCFMFVFLSFPSPGFLCFSLYVLVGHVLERNSVLVCIPCTFSLNFFFF